LNKSDINNQQRRERCVEEVVDYCLKKTDRVYAHTFRTDVHEKCEKIYSLGQEKNKITAFRTISLTL
jgi:hypothetical protein